jgi:uncharacterized protein YndB with AHSA1/START domain
MNRDTYQPGPLAQVSWQPDGDRVTLVFVRDLPHPPRAVWSALTDPTKLAQWAPFTAERDLGQTGEVTLTMIDGDEATDLKATVTRVEPNERLEYTWGGDLLRWDLAPTADGTRLTLRHTMADRSMLPKIAAGWHLCLDVADHLLGGDAIGPIRGQDAMNYGFPDLSARYENKLGRPE